MLKLGLLLGCVGLLGGATANNTIQSDISRKNADFDVATSEVVYHTSDITIDLISALCDALFDAGYKVNNHLIVNGVNKSTTATSNFADIWAVSSETTKSIRVSAGGTTNQYTMLYADLTEQTITYNIWTDHSDSNHTLDYISIKSSTFYTIAESVNNQINMPSATDLFGYITQGVTGFISSLGQAFTSVVALFWDSTASAPTFIGLLTP